MTPARQRPSLVEFTASLPTAPSPRRIAFRLGWLVHLDRFGFGIVERPIVGLEGRCGEPFLVVDEVTLGRIHGSGLTNGDGILNFR